jgi:hypothetical protein
MKFNPVVICVATPKVTQVIFFTYEDVVRHDILLKVRLLSSISIYKSSDVSIMYCVSSRKNENMVGDIFTVTVSAQPSMLRQFLVKHSILQARQLPCEFCVPST